ncbi:MAG: DUF3467 domain-containing protein [Elusimicrobiota bacterium]|nr:DUF3467 domain-containing protein [Elusimicrobiota bacterium]
MLPKAKPDTGRSVQLQVETDDDIAQGVYANMAVVSHAETEFVYDFGFLFPGQPKAGIGARVISSPVQSKRLCAALRENIKNYEARFGPIKSGF